MDNTKKTDKPIKEIDNKNEIDLIPLRDGIKLTEIFETTNLSILPKYDIIVKNDLTTVRKVVIIELPYLKFIEKLGKDLRFMTISDNGIKYSLGADSVALRRSLISCAINIGKPKIVSEIDESILIGKTLGIKREQFTTKGFTQAPLKFFVLE